MEDIFSFKDIKKKDFLNIIVDFREKNSMVPSYLIKSGVNVIFENLEIGDYIVGDIIIERKSANDFFSSIYSGHLKEQMKNMFMCDKKVLVIEGIFDYKNFNKKVFWGFFKTYSILFKIPILVVFNEKDFSDFIISLVSKKKSLNKNRYKKTKKTLLEKRIFFLEGIFGIGNKSAMELLKKFGSIKNIINSEKDDLLLILNKNVCNEFFSVIN